MSANFYRLPHTFVLLAALYMTTACENKTQQTTTDETPPPIAAVSQDSLPTAAPPPAPPPVETPAAAHKLAFALPKDEGEYTIVPTRQKDGFIQAELRRGKQTVAYLSIVDTKERKSPIKLKAAKEATIAGFPVVPQGKTGTGILVASRWQVQVRSKHATFAAAEREEWLKKFDLQKLAALR